MRGRSDLAALVAVLFICSGAWPAVGRVVREMNPSTIPTALVPEMNRFGISSPPRSFLKRMFSVLAVQQLLDKLHAFEIEELRILLLTAVERHADLPGPCEHDRVLNGRFVRHYIRAQARVALHHVQLVAMEITSAVKPGPVVLVGDVDHQGIAFPVSDGLAHPRVGWSGPGVFQEDVSHRARVLVDERERACALQNLEWVG